MRDFEPYVPATARVWDYLRGGRDNFEADRVAGTALVSEYLLPVAGRENYKFVRRAVHHLAAGCGVRQFVEIGVGLPPGRPVHEVAQSIAPGCRVAYVDDDPMVLVFARALLTGRPEGYVDVVDADLRKPADLIAAVRHETMIDLDEPVGLLLCAVLHEITDAERPESIVGELVQALASGSYVVLSHYTTDPLRGETDRYRLAELAEQYQCGPFQARSRDQVTRLLDGLDLVAPGVVSTVHWRPDLEPVPDQDLYEAEAMCYAAVAKRP